MAIPEPLRSLAGSWTGTNRLQDPNTNSPQDSPSTAILTLLLGGRFLRFDYTWSYHGQPQEGSLLMGGDPSSGSATVHWIDTWHMSHAVLACQGTATANGALNAKGAYPAPPGPDWGWRIAVVPGDALRIVMHNIWPEGKEELAVEAWYQRA